MKNTQGVSEKAYTLDSQGRRYCPSPFPHYPDLCPLFPSDKVGDCLKECADLPESERPCCKEATKGTSIPAPAPPISPSEEAAHHDGAVDKEALDALGAQIEDFGKTVQSEIAKLAVAVGILRSRV